MCRLRLACGSIACFFLQDVHDVQAEDVDMSLGQQNPQLWFLGEQNPQSKLNLEEDAGVHYPHWCALNDVRMHHIGWTV